MREAIIGAALAIGEVSLFHDLAPYTADTSAICRLFNSISDSVYYSILAIVHPLHQRTESATAHNICDIHSIINIRPAVFDCPDRIIRNGWVIQIYVCGLAIETGIYRTKIRPRFVPEPYFYEYGFSDFGYRSGIF